MKISAIVLVLTIAMSTTALLVSPSTSPTMAQGPSQSQTLTPAAINGEVSSLGQFAQKIHGNFSSEGLSEGVTSAFARLSSNQAFEDALANHGFKALSWGIGYDFRTGRLADARVGFNIIWNDSTTQYEQSWTLFMTNSSEKGPTLSSSPIVTNGNSHNWGGWVFYDGAPFTYYLTAVTSNIDVSTVTWPPSGTVGHHHGYSVYLESTVWIGISPNSDGSGGLAQEGYYRNVNTSSSYILWYEIFGCGSNCPVNGMTFFKSNQCTSGTFVTSPGDILSLTIYYSNGVYYFDTYDYSLSTSCSASYSFSNNPDYAEFIVEAPSSWGQIQQIPKLSSATNFEGAQVTKSNLPGTPIDVTTMYDYGLYYENTLNQKSGILNSEQAYVMAYGTYHTNIYGYPQVTWVSSNYDYCYVNPLYC